MDPVNQCTTDEPDVENQALHYSCPTLDTASMRYIMLRVSNEHSMANLQEGEEKVELRHELIFHKKLLDKNFQYQFSVARILMSSFEILSASHGSPLFVSSSIASSRIIAFSLRLSSKVMDESSRRQLKQEHSNLNNSLSS